MHSILRITSRDETSCIVVCETKNDEDEIIRLAGQEGHTVTNVVAAEDSDKGIFLNDFQM